MQENTVQGQPVQVKEKHPADDRYDRWSVTGEAGKVVYDVLGNHLALIPALGEIDSVMGRTLARTREYALLNEDELVFGILAGLYRTELEFPGSGAVIDGEVVEVTLALPAGDGESVVVTERLPVSADNPPDRVCRYCGATEGLKMLFGPPFYTPQGYECYDACGGAR